MNTCKLCGIEMAEWFFDEIELLNITTVLCHDCSYCIFQHVDAILELDRVENME